MDEPLRESLDDMEWTLRDARALHDHVSSLHPALARVGARLTADLDQALAAVNAAQDGDEDALNGL